ncbi:MAG: TonB-dependent receptor [Campylobacteraceae bacterium]|jgi:outer membrane receptor for ferrienterochelin and colicins|nr:TonB-dependent receptor [Campylobacteraceae bacterium]
MRERKRVLCSVAAALVCFASLSYAQTDANETVKLEEIKVVSAAGYEQNIADAPASVFVITKEELENKSFNDLTDILKNVPGVSIDGGSVFKDISIRGMSSGYTLYLVDGKPLPGSDAHSPNAMAGGIATNSLPPVSNIERIEVVRGPMSSLYGSEAMGGVINIITKKVPSEWTGSIGGEYTKSRNDISEDGYQANFYLSGPIVKDILSLQTYGSFIGLDESTAKGGSKSSSSNPDFKNRQVGAKLIWALNDANSLWVNYDYSKQQRVTTPGKSISTTSTARNGTVTDNKVSENLAIKQTISAGHDLKLSNLILSTYIQNAVTKNPSRGNGIDYEILTANTQGTYFFEANSLTIGAQFRKEILDDRATNVMHAAYNGSTWNYKSYEVSKWQYAVFAEDEWNILDNFALTGGIRLNTDEKFGRNISPRIYAVYGITEDLVLKGGISSGYKVPSLRQSADDFGGVSGGGSYPPVAMIGSPDVKPESSINYEISVAYANKDVGLDTSLTIYHSEFKDKIESYDVCDSNASTALPFCTQSSADHYGYPGMPSLDLNGGPYSRAIRYKNVDGAMIEGIEITLSYNILSNLVFGTTYTYTKSEQKSGDNKGKPLNNTPKHVLNANVDYKLTSKFSVWSQYNYRGKYPEVGDTTTITNKSYSFVDLGAVYKLKNNIKLTAGLYNVLNKEITNETHGRHIDGRRITAGFNINF